MTFHSPYLIANALYVSLSVSYLKLYLYSVQLQRVGNYSTGIEKTIPE